MIRFLLDQGIPRSATAPLAAAGWDVEHVADIGLSRASDLQIIEKARADNRIICTLDADFHALLAVSDASHPTVIRVRQEGLDGRELSALLLKVWTRIEDACGRGALVTISDRTLRVRRLPLSLTQQNHD